MLYLKLVLMILAVALSGYGAYGFWSQEITLYIGGKAELLHSNGVFARFLGAAVFFMGLGVFSVLGSSISRHPIRQYSWETAAKCFGACLLLSLLLMIVYILLISY